MNKDIKRKLLYIILRIRKREKMTKPTLQELIKIIERKTKEWASSSPWTESVTRRTLYRNSSESRSGSENQVGLKEGWDLKHGIIALFSRFRS